MTTRLLFTEERCYLCGRDLSAGQGVCHSDAHLYVCSGECQARASAVRESYDAMGRRWRPAELRSTLRAMRAEVAI